MIAVLFYYEDEKESDQIMTVDEMATNRLFNLYGYEMFIIDRTGTRSGSMIFHSLDEAIEDHRFKDHTWMYFDRFAGEYLVTHPKENVVYVIGSDLEGYGYDKKSIEERNGKSYKLSLKNPMEIHHANPIMSYVMAHRWINVGC